MITNLTTPKEYTVYPGEYVPMPDREILFQKLMQYGKASLKHSVDIDELPDCFKIKICLPAAKREDIFVYVKHNVLTVIVLDSGLKSSKKVKPLDSTPQFWERHLTLPYNADAEFLSAECNEGILSICLPKTCAPNEVKAHQIVIY